MSEYERSIDLRVPAQQAFDYLSTISNLPVYLPRIKEARLDEESHVTAFTEVNGQPRTLDGWFRVTDSARRIDWGSDGTPDYRGWLEVAQIGPDRCRLTVHLSMDPATVKGLPAEAGATESVDAALEGVLNGIRRLLEEERAGERAGQPQR